MARKLLLLLFLSVTTLDLWSQQKGEIAFTIDEKDLIPEGIAYDPAEKAFYLGSIQKNKVVKIHSDGKVAGFISSGQDSLQSVLGMKVHDGNLWVCNNSPEYDTANVVSYVHVFNLKSGQLVKKFQIKDGMKHLFNDIHFLKNGDAYITDSDGGAVYTIRHNTSFVTEILRPGTLRYPNGITASEDESRIFVSTGSGLGIVSIDLKTNQFTPVTHPKFLIIGTDGLYRYKNDLIGVQNVLFPEAIVRFKLSEDDSAIPNMEFLISNNQYFDTPTTGVVVGDEFYFIANSQLRQVVGNKGKIKNPEKLTSTYIMKIKLN